MERFIGLAFVVLLAIVMTLLWNHFASRGRRARLSRRTDMGVPEMLRTYYSGSSTVSAHSLEEALLDIGRALGVSISKLRPTDLPRIWQATVAGSTTMICQPSVRWSREG